MYCVNGGFIKGWLLCLPLSRYIKQVVFNAPGQPGESIWHCLWLPLLNLCTPPCILFVLLLHIILMQDKVVFVPSYSIWTRNSKAERKRENKQSKAWEISNLTYQCWCSLQSKEGCLLFFLQVVKIDYIISDENFLPLDFNQWNDGINALFYGLTSWCEE